LQLDRATKISKTHFIAKESFYSETVLRKTCAKKHAKKLFLRKKFFLRQTTFFTPKNFFTAKNFF